MSLIENEDRPNKVMRLAERIDRDSTKEIAMRRDAGGIILSSLDTVMEFAKAMAVSDIAIPKHLRGNAGACMAVTLQAYEWGVSPLAAMNKSYSVNDRLAYESQLVHAIILARAPIKGRLKTEYTGEGPMRKCKVWAVLRDEIAMEPGEIVSWESPLFKDIKPKNSPLWVNDPDMQQFYWTSRAFARRHFPDVLLGIYEREEIEYAEPLRTDDNLAGKRAQEMGERLARAKAAPAIGAAGFDAKTVENGTAEIEGKASPAPQGEPEKPKEETKPQEQQSKPAPEKTPQERAPIEERATLDYRALVEAFRVKCDEFTDKDALEHFVSDFGEHEDDAWYGEAPDDVLDQIDEIANARVKAIYEEGQARTAEVDGVMGTSAPDEDEPPYSELLMELETDLTAAKTEAEVGAVAARHSGKGSWYDDAPADVKAIAEKLVLDNTLRTREVDKAAAPAPAAEKPKRAPRAKAEEKPASPVSNDEAAILKENPDLLGTARLKASRGTKRLKMWLNSISQHDYDLLTPFMSELEKTAAAAVVDEL